MRSRRFGNFFTREHSGDLFDTIGFSKLPYADRRFVSTQTFLHREVPVRERRNLRLMRDTQNLLRLRELFQLQTYGLRYAAADARIDLIKDSGLFSVTSFRRRF